MRIHSETEIRFSDELLDRFRRDVGSIRPETGGMIGCSTDPSLIDLYVFDSSSQNTSISFDYDEKAMTKVYRTWRETGGKAVGFIHSHPDNCTRPSYDDISMALTLMRFFKNDFFYMPIIKADRRGFYTLFFYVLHMSEHEVTMTYEYAIEATANGYSLYPQHRIINKYPIRELESYYGPDKVAADRASRIYPRSESGTERDAQIRKAEKVPSYSPEELFVRLFGVYPEKVLEKVIVVIGIGGARSIVENLTRSGFRHFILIDGDTVAPSNIATQGVTCSEIGKKKVYALKRRLEDINPNVNVMCVDRYLDDSISDECFAGWLGAFPGRKASDFLILGCTDSFPAQKRIALLALKYSIPYIGATMFEKGLAAEVIFVYPGVTESCPRCLLRSRYEAYENGYKNTVTSAGCSPFATERLNTTIGMLSVMILMYHDAPGMPENDMLDEIADRNYLLIRLSPRLGDSPLGIRLFDRVFGDEGVRKYTFMDETLWIPQHPDSSEYGEEPCKLCGGTGDLTTLKGRWEDTRTAAQ